MARYRDSETGYFVSESTYNRSVAHGGTRYYEAESEFVKPAPPVVPEEFYEFEDLYFGGFEADEEAEY